MDQSPKVLIAGGTGFIGRRLQEALAKKKISVAVLGRREPPSLPSPIEFRRCDLLNPDKLEKSLAGIDTVFYLVHSLGAGSDRFRDFDRRAAENFRFAADRTKIGRVIYLGGLGGSDDALSDHLKSRREIEDVLREGRFALTVLRAAIIIGKGGASFEILRALVKTQPLIPDPPGLATRCQPIAADDVVAYLVGCLEEEKTAGQIFDIGGPDIMTYRDLLEGFAAAAEDLNLFLPIPALPKALSARWIGLVSGVPAPVVRALLDGLDNEVICRENRIRDLLPIPLTTFREAVRQALAEKG